MPRSFHRLALAAIASLGLLHAASARSMVYDSIKHAHKDTCTVPIVRALKFNATYEVPQLISLDTTNAHSYRYNAAYQRSLYPGYLGNVGQASYDIDFENRERLDDDVFLDPYSLTFFSYKDLDYYNTRRPFTRLSYIDGANDEALFNVLHTQNVNKECNVGLEMKFLGAEGSYMYQKSSGRQMRAWANYFGSRYSVVSQYSFNRLYTEENGGICNLNDVNTLGAILGESPLQVEMNIDEASSKNKFSQFYARQEFNLASRYKKPDSLRLDLYEFPLALGHEIISDNANRTYNETLSDESFEFYPGTPSDSVQTMDSAKYRMMSNMLYLKIAGNRRKSLAMMLGGGVESEMHQFADYAGYDPAALYHNSYLQANIWTKGNAARGFNIAARYYANGRKAENYSGDCSLFTTFNLLGEPTMLTVSAHADGQSPSYFFNTYSGNFYQWQRDFNHQITNKVSLKLASLKQKFEVRASASVINNYMYFNQVPDSANGYSSQAIEPAQESGGIAVLSALLSKKTRLWFIELENSVLLQQSSNEDAISLPKLATFNTLSFHVKMFKNKLLLRPGVDVYTWTAFYLPGYSSELGVFYTQHELRYWAYPFTDVFVQLNFKRMQVFFKYAQVGYYFTGSNDLFSVHRYPLQKANFSYGISWYFYN